jgi:hypothetical protein
LCPAEQERLFCYAAEGKLLAHYIQKGMPYRVNPNKPIGKNKISTFMKEICERTGCVPPKTGEVTNHGGRRHGINLMAQAGVSTSENITHARHRNANVNAQYQQNTEVTRSTRVMAQRSDVVPTGPRRSGVTRMMYSLPPPQDSQAHAHARHNSHNNILQEQRYSNQYARGRSTTMITNRPT